MTLRFLSATFGCLLIAMLAIAQAPKEESPKKSDPGSGSREGGSSKTAPKPGSLEELLDKALKNHPDLRVAASKIRTAEAKLQEARDEYSRDEFRILALVTDAHRKVQLAKENVALVKARLEITLDASRRGTIPQSEITQAKAEVATAQTALESAEQYLKALTGDLPSSKTGKTSSSSGEGLAFSLNGELLWSKEANGQLRVWEAHSFHKETVNQQCQSCHAVSNPADWKGVRLNATAPTMNDRIRKTLDMQVSVQSELKDISLSDFFGFLQQSGNVDVPLRMMYKNADEKNNLDVMPGQLSVGAWFQVVEDSFPDLRFVIREYGILVTNKDRVPDGAVYLQAFWKHKETHAPTKKEKELPK